MTCRTKASPPITGPDDFFDDTEELRAEVTKLRARNAELEGALFKLEAWGKCFIETTPISAETLWREFPIAMERAAAVLAKAKS